GPGRTAASTSWAGTGGSRPAPRRTAAGQARLRRPRPRRRPGPRPPSRFPSTPRSSRARGWIARGWIAGGWIAGGWIARGAGPATLAAEDLAGGALGQLVDQPEVAGVLVRRDPVLHVRPQFLGRGRGAGLERDGRADLLAELVVGDPDHGRLGDRGMLVEDLLDLARVDVVAAADDHLLLAVHDEEVAVLVHPGQVTSPEPAVRDRLGRGLGLAPVALHHVVAADGDLADLADGERGAVGADHAHLDALHRRPDRPGLALGVRVVERGDRGGLRQPVPLEDHAAERLLEAVQDLHGHRRAAGHAGAQRRG